MRRLFFQLKARRVRLALTTTVLLLFSAFLIYQLKTPQPVQAAASELFISEYIEGSSNNKAIEIYNGTGAAVNLATSSYNLQMYFNGSASAGLTINLTGTVAAGDVYVVAQSSANAAILAQADQTNGSGWFNGDDAVVLRKGTTIIDVIGQIGFDPGTEWGTGLTSTADNTLRRKSAVCSGDTNGSNVFDPSTEWDGFATDTVSDLGSHTASCGDAAPFVASVNPANSAVNVASNSDVTINFSEAVNVTGAWFTITGSLSGPHPAAVSGGPTSFTLNPDVDFASGELVSVTVVAGQVTDQDSVDPPDNMAADFGWSFTTVTVSTSPTVSGLASPNLVPAGTTTLLTAAVTPGTNPASTGIAVTGNLTAIGGSASQQFFDNGTNGDVTAGDNVFSYLALVGALNPQGVKSLSLTVTDAQSRSGSGSISLTVDPPNLAINQIQGSGTTSPFASLRVRTSGIVTGRRSNGFFIQTPDAEVDADPNTSEGILVFTSSAPPAAAAVGNQVAVTGTVSEFIPSADPYSPPLTELSVSPVVTLISSGNPLPAPVTLMAAQTSPTGGVEQLERFEGMRVRVDSLTAVSPTGGFTDENDALGNSNGVFYGVITGLGRPFREPGIDALNPLPAGAPAGVPRFDGNPEKLRVDSDGIGAPLLEVTSGAVITNLVGPLDFSFRTYTIMPEPTSVPEVTGNISAIPAPAPGADEFTVASFNMERFFDTVNDPGIGDPVLTTTAFNNRLNKASLAIRNVMRTPDIIGVEEVENLSTLQAIAAKVNSDAVAAGDPDPGYVAYLIEGNDPGGIDPGFLVKTGGARVTVIDVTQEGKTTTYIDPNSGLPDLLNDRPPLILRAVINHPDGPAFPVTVIVNHLRSLIGVDDPVDGNRVRTKRRAQAEFLANLIQTRQSADPTEKIISVGDYNAFQFNDGYVDSIGTIKGTPTPANEVVLASTDLVNPDLIDLVDQAPVGQRYSFVFDGTAQELDHILITNNLLVRLNALFYGRSNSDFPESLRSDSTRPERLSDHDMPIGYFSFPKADLSVTKTSSGTVTSSNSLTYTIEVSNSLDDPAVNLTLSDPLPAGATFKSVTAPSGWTCTTPAVGSNGTVTCAADSLASGATAGFTLVVDVDCDLANGTVLSNQVTIGSETLDPDTANNTKTAQATVSNPPPVISGESASPSLIWPPNHKLVDVNVVYSVTDNCGAPSCVLSVSSNEPENGLGDGDTDTDWEVVNSKKVRLRAERAGSGEGRTYTITITCTDSAGGRSSRTVTVTVPKSKK